MEEKTRGDINLPKQPHGNGHFIILHTEAAVRRCFETPTQVFFCEICKNFKNAFFYIPPPVAASDRRTMSMRAELIKTQNAQNICKRTSIMSLSVFSIALKNNFK